MSTPTSPAPTGTAQRSAGRIALVTGASGGIGAATAQRLARAGAAVELLPRLPAPVAPDDDEESPTVHAIGIEVPATDLHRAKRFYETVFGHAPTDVIEADGRVRTIVDGTPGVFINQTAGFTPTADGTLPYYHVEDLDAAVAAVPDAGGRVLDPPTPRADLGRFAHVLDSEGNGLYLHGA